MSPWRLSYRADPRGKTIADRHYNRQNPDSPQFVPPGACLVLMDEDGQSLWVTSWPIAKYVQHAWAGAWVNSTFRRESSCGHLASDLITAAVAATRSIWEPPPLGMVSFVDARKVVSRNPGYCYLKAGWMKVGMTKSGLLAFQVKPEDMPDPESIIGAQMTFDWGGEVA